MDTLQTEPLLLERTWDMDGIPVLTANISLPAPVKSAGRIERRIQRYYQSQSRAFLRYCTRFLLPQAQTACRIALETSTPLPCFHASLTYTVTYQQDGFWSLYTQSREVTSYTLLRRWGDTWNLHTGYPVPLPTFLPKTSGWKRAVFARIAADIQQQESAGIARYRTDWRHGIRRWFNPRNFYRTEHGIVLFYPMFTLAPAAEGIPTFLFPCPNGTEIFSHSPNISLTQS